MEIKELHCIMPIVNILLVMKYGILSKSEIRRRKLPYQSIADEKVQTLRSQKFVPEGMLLHDYANLYFDAHNPMLSKVRDNNKEICVLRIDSAVMRLPGVVITDMNAASRYVRFYPYRSSLDFLNFEMIYAPCWLHPENKRLELKHKAIKCAEVLVPRCVEKEYIKGAYVYDEETMHLLRSAGFEPIIEVKSELFF